MLALHVSMAMLWKLTIWKVYSKSTVKNVRIIYNVLKRHQDISYAAFSPNWLAGLQRVAVFHKPQVAQSFSRQ